MCDETALEEYLENGTVSDDTIAALIGRTKAVSLLFWLWHESMEGVVKNFWKVFFAYAREPEYPAAFGAKVYKITRDAQGVRLTHMKITGGSLAVKQLLSGVKRRWRRRRGRIGNLVGKRSTRSRIHSGEKGR